LREVSLEADKTVTVEVREKRRWQKDATPSLWGDLYTKPHADGAGFGNEMQRMILKQRKSVRFLGPHPLRD
jgi:hypothetical protein